MAQKKAVVLLSGGLDSCVAGTVARCEGYRVYALSFDYGQRHARELESARAVAAALRVEEHKLLRVPLEEIGGSALTDRAIDVPDAPGLAPHRPFAEQGRPAGGLSAPVSAGPPPAVRQRAATPGRAAKTSTGQAPAASFAGSASASAAIGQQIPVTYVPARNTIFLAFALAYAEVKDARAIFIGANALDYSGYPDCRPAYFEAFEELARLATKQGVEAKQGEGVRIVAPLLELRKKDIVQMGLELKAPMHLTWSCYRGGDKACGRCESCILRLKGFREAGAVDPVPYESDESR